MSCGIPDPLGVESTLLVVAYGPLGLLWPAAATLVLPWSRAAGWLLFAKVSMQLRLSEMAAIGRSACSSLLCAG